MRPALRQLAAFVVALALSLLASCTLPMRDLRANSAEKAAIAANPAPLPSERGFAVENRTPRQRDAIVRNVWRTIRSRYYDPAFGGKDIDRLEARTLDEARAVDNDAAFYRVLKRNVRALDDSHTLVLTPRESENNRARRATQIGIVYDFVEQRIVVERVVPNFPADRAGIRGGMLLDAIDGRPLDPGFLDRPRDAGDDADSVDDPAPTTAADAARLRALLAVRSLLVANTGLPPVAHRLTLRRVDDSVFDATVQAIDGDVPTRIVHRLLPSGIGVIGFNRFDVTSRDALRAALDDLADARAMIVDLRGNGGGEESMFVWLLARFVSQPTRVGEVRGREGVPEELVARPGRPSFLRPLAVLVDRGTASAAELAAHALVERRGAIAVGGRTCGCVVAVRGEYVLPDNGALHVSERGYRSPDGRRMEHDPLVPAIAVTPTLSQRRHGDDVALEAAERALIARLAPPGAQTASGEGADR